MFVKLGVEFVLKRRNHGIKQINWQEIHLSKDEASAQGTRAVRFVVQQVEKAQKNPYLKPILNNLMMARARTKDSQL